MDPMNEEPDIYHAYLLRLWSVQVKGKRQWRASLESPHTGEHQSFASLEQCFAYLGDKFVRNEYNHEGH
jgi:hypothetical protein